MHVISAFFVCVYLILFSNKETHNINVYSIHPRKLKSVATGHYINPAPG